VEICNVGLGIIDVLDQIRLRVAELRRQLSHQGLVVPVGEDHAKPCAVAFNQLPKRGCVCRAPGPSVRKEEIDVVGALQEVVPLDIQIMPRDTSQAGILYVCGQSRRVQ